MTHLLRVHAVLPAVHNNVVHLQIVQARRIEASMQVHEAAILGGVPGGLLHRLRPGMWRQQPQRVPHGCIADDGLAGRDLCAVGQRDARRSAVGHVDMIHVRVQQEAPAMLVQPPARMMHAAFRGQNARSGCNGTYRSIAVKCHAIHPLLQLMIAACASRLTAWHNDRCAHWHCYMILFIDSLARYGEG